MNKVEEAILAGAREKAREVLERAKTQSRENETVLVNQTRTESNQLIESERKRLEEQHQQALSDLKQSFERKLSVFKRETIEKLLEKLEKAFFELPKKKQYREFLKNASRIAEKEFKNPTVLLRKEDFSKVPKHFKKKAISCKGGLMAQNDQGDISLDYRLESVLEREKENALDQLMKEIDGSERK